MQFRLAENKDIDQLIQMRWNFTLEDNQSKTYTEDDLKTFKLECRSF